MSTQKLEIIFKRSKLERFLNSLNSEIISKNISNDAELFKIKKLGAQAPDNFSEKPPQKTKDNENYIKAKQEFDERRKVHQEQQKVYDNYTSREYLEGQAFYKIYSTLKEIQELQKKTETVAIKKRIDELIKKLSESGIKRPVHKTEVKEGKDVKVLEGQAIVLKFTDICPDVANVSDIDKIIGGFFEKHKVVIDLFSHKKEIKKCTFKFNKNVTNAVGYTLQKGIESLFSLALDDTRKSTRSTVKIESLCSAVVSQSEFYPLFHGLRSLETLNNYVVRLQEYNSQRAVFLTTQKKKKSTSNNVLDLISFEDSERKNSHMKVMKKAVTGQTASKETKFWKDLNNDDKVNFCGYVENIFEKVKSDKSGFKRYKLSSRAKEYVSNLCVQCLQTISMHFESYRNHKNTEIKSITLETTVFLLGVILKFHSSENLRKLETHIREMHKKKTDTV